MLASVPWAARNGRHDTQRGTGGGAQAASGGGDDVVSGHEPQQRPKPQRPREKLGCLLPASSAKRPLRPDLDALAREQDQVLAIELFNAGNSSAFDANEE